MPHRTVSILPAYLTSMTTVPVFWFHVAVGLGDRVAMQAGIAKELMSMADLCAMMDEPAYKKRGPYKKAA